VVPEVRELIEGDVDVATDLILEVTVNLAKRFCLLAPDWGLDT